MWDFFSDPAREFVKNLEAGSVSLKKKGLSSHKTSFDSVFEGECEQLQDFLEREAGIWDVGFDIQPGPRESRADSLPDEALTKLKKPYQEAAPLPPEAFVGLFVERLKSDPERILDFLDKEFEYLRVGISGSRSDRFNYLTLRPKWHYEYLICAMKYCVESEAKKDFMELFGKPAGSSGSQFIWGLRADLGDKESDGKELSAKETLIAQYSVKADSAATTMVKEAGITDLKNINYENVVRVCTATLTNLLDYELMKIWPAPATPHEVPAYKYRNIFDLYIASCKYFSS